MLNSAKSSQKIVQENTIPERRKNGDRRVSTNKTRFPFIDDNSKLVMKDRRKDSRRTSDVTFRKNPLKVVSNLIKK